MSKPNKYGNKPSWRTQYSSEHDYRGERRVNFKANSQGNKKVFKDWSASIRAHLLDEDIDMGASAGPSRHFNKRHFKNKRSGSPAPNQQQQNRRKLYEGPTNWYRVTVPFGNKYEKQFILRLFLDKLNPLPFWPITWATSGTVATFYVDDFKVAEKLHSLDRSIQMPDGFKLMIKVHSGSPNVDINAEMKEKIKLTMAKRYNAVNKALDLTRFHADPDLQDHFCALFKPIVFLAIIDIIAENIPELEALNLNDNRIQIMSYLKKVGLKLPNLKILHIGNNKIRDISMLDPLIGLPLIELVLDGNPLCDKFKDQVVYIRTFNKSLRWPLGSNFSVYSEVRKRFPKVIKLDEQVLPPPISFDISDDMHHLPPPVQTFLCNSDGSTIVRQFLEQYFVLFDGDDRQPLLQAYHEHALFSMTMAYPYGSKDKGSSWLNWYSTDNRNILRVFDPIRRMKLLKQGHVSIISFLQEMPRTTHDIHNFNVDLTVFTPQMLSLTVSGMYKELRTGHKVPPIRAFFRTLVIVAAGSGYCIANEELHVTNATEDQAKMFKSTPVVPLPTLVAAPVVVAPVPAVGAVDDTTKQQMVQAMATQSGMNLDWSTKCLEETTWDFQRALLVFGELQKQGVIPPEAFAK